MYDITNRESFKLVYSHLQNIRNTFKDKKNKILYCIVGNKSDLAAK